MLESVILFIAMLGSAALPDEKSRVGRWSRVALLLLCAVTLSEDEDTVVVI
jgi:hypothetical protein